MRRPLRWLTGLAATFAAACAPQAPAVDIAAETAALTAVIQAYHDAGEALDTEVLAASYTQDSAMYPPGGPAVEGLPAIREFVAGFASVPDIQMSFELVDVAIAASGDLGYSMSTAAIASVGPDGEPVSENIRDFHVWTKDAGGEWKLLIDIWNSPDPVTPPEG